MRKSDHIMVIYLQDSRALLQPSIIGQTVLFHFSHNTIVMDIEAKSAIILLLQTQLECATAPRKILQSFGHLLQLTHRSTFDIYKFALIKVQHETGTVLSECPTNHCAGCDRKKHRLPARIDRDHMLPGHAEIAVLSQGVLEVFNWIDIPENAAHELS